MKMLTALLPEDGQGLTEYALILGAVVIAAAGGLLLAGSKVLSLYTGAEARFRLNLR